MCYFLCRAKRWDSIEYRAKWGFPSVCVYNEQGRPVSWALQKYYGFVANLYTEEEYNKLQSFIDHSRDFLFTYAGLRQVCDKYLVQDRSSGEVYETPQFMYFYRISLVQLFTVYSDLSCCLMTWYLSSVSWLAAVALPWGVCYLRCTLKKWIFLHQAISAVFSDWDCPFQVSTAIMYGNYKAVLLIAQQ